jgi:hypothetical protein
MVVECLKCNIDNSDTVKFYEENGALLRFVRGTDAADAEPDPISGQPSEDIPASFTKTMETPKEELTTGMTFARR